MKRPSGWREAAYGIGIYGAYMLVRRLVWNPAGRAKADRNARRIVEWEERFGLHIEPEVQRIALKAPRLVNGLNAGYAIANVGLSVGWLIWLFRRNEPCFRAERRAALTAFGLSLPIFALAPTAPPRSLDGFVDTMAEGGLPLDHPLVVRFYNPIAAMPSQHLAFAVVTGWGLARQSRTPVGRAGWRAYPGVVAIVVMATANHFVVDVMAGAAVGALARKVAA